MSIKLSDRTSVTFLATYPPRKCGIGTFTHDLASGISDRYGEELSNSGHVSVIAINDRMEGYDYDDEVSFEVNSFNKMDFRKAADYINLSDNKVVSVQHEFGIFGGDDGDHVLTFLDTIRKPVVSTFHTILENPSDHQREVLKEVCDRSSRVVVLANKGIDLLEDVYDVSANEVTMVPHGAPDVPFLDTSYYKDDFEIEGRSLLLTFGLLSPNKGIEVAIGAMEKVVEEFPDALYIVLGRTHPHVKRERGEEYRLELERSVREKGLSNNITFHDRFVPLEELTKYLVTADVYLTPYLSKEQISSGTLAYAVAMGKAVVSTPYWYAEELLADGRGKLVPFEDPGSTAEAIKELLRDEPERQGIRRAAYQFGRNMIWSEVASQYHGVFERAISDYKDEVKVSVRPGETSRDSFPDLPEVKLDHLKRLTDGVGILQHASFTVPNRHFGYTTDDNARAAIAAIEHSRLFGEDPARDLLDRYLSFLLYSVDQETGKVNNFLTYDGKWVAEDSKEDSHGRFLWAMGKLVGDCRDEGLSRFGTQLFQGVLEPTKEFTSPRAKAFTVLGIRHYLKKFEGDRNTRLFATDLCGGMVTALKNNSSEDWVWPEDSVTYENARIPQALIVWGNFTGNEEMRDWGLRALRWLIDWQIDGMGNYLSIIGNDGWLVRGGNKADYDQQPVEVAALIDACWEAYDATNDKDFLNLIHTAFNWFLGSNDLGETVYDFHTGGCRDGLHPSRVNENEGAESLLSWLLSLYRMYRLAGEFQDD
ncbi:MAG: glycosyltransferase family 4 protein [Candidatus Acetothermia bacterium]